MTVHKSVRPHLECGTQSNNLNGHLLGTDCNIESVNTYLFLKFLSDLYMLLKKVENVVQWMCELIE